VIEPVDQFHAGNRRTRTNGKRGRGHIIARANDSSAMLKRPLSRQTLSMGFPDRILRTAADTKEKPDGRVAKAAGLLLDTQKGSARHRVRIE
jgi:hypothetical protein